MKFTGVTFSGPDSTTAIGTLVELQRKFPYMEVGVLWSLKAAGQPRYADRDWIEQASALGLNFSIHLCGKVARQLVEEGEPPVVPGTPKRVQINCNGMKPLPEWYRGLDTIADEHGTKLQFIIQTCDHNGAYWVGMAQGARWGERGVCVPLFDQSGGKGQLPEEWPNPLPFTHCGYAGGIGPDNAQALVRHLKTLKGESFWIDMETKVRTGDVFDLDKVVHVLNLVDNLIDRSE